jgi:hypothetical protein
MNASKKPEDSTTRRHTETQNKMGSGAPSGSAPGHGSSSTPGHGSSRSGLGSGGGLLGWLKSKFGR